MKKIFKILSRERCFKEDVLGEVTDIQRYRIVIVCRVLNFIFSLSSVKFGTKAKPEIGFLY